MPSIAATEERLDTKTGFGHVRCGSRWFVVQSHPQAERWARDNLSDQGFTVYLPLQLVRVRDRVLRTLTREILRPLFSSYLFVQFDPDRDPWRPICSTRGVRRLFMTGFRPLPVTPGDVERLQAHDAERIKSDTDAGEWEPGASCSLGAGPFTGHAAVVVSVEDEIARVTVLVFGALRDVTVPLAHLAPPVANPE